MRADSGFFSRELFEFLEQRAIAYVVVARLTSSLKRLAAGVRDWREVDEDSAVGEFFAQLHGWDRRRRFVAVLFTFNLLSLYQKVAQPQATCRQPATLRAAVFFGGAVLGRAARKPVLLISQAWGGSKSTSPSSRAFWNGNSRLRRSWIPTRPMRRRAPRFEAVF